MAIIKLQQGQSAVLAVTQVVPDVPATNPRYGPSTKFVGRTPTDPDACVFLSPETALRQLRRHGLTLETAVGRTLEFSKPGEYIDINLPSGTPALALVPAGPAPVAPTASAPSAAQLAEQREERLRKLGRLHKRCLQFVLANELPLLTAAKVEGSSEAVSALTAQLYIAAKDDGLHL
jgi:hypothetical protein